jgi:hypothetical protein
MRRMFGLVMFCAPSKENKHGVLRRTPEAVVLLRHGYMPGVVVAGACGPTMCVTPVSPRPIVAGELCIRVVP